MEVSHTLSCGRRFYDYAIQKKWVAISLLVTSLVVLGLLIFLRGMDYGTGSSLAKWAFFCVTGALSVAGSLLATALLWNKGRTPLDHAIEKGVLPLPEIRDHYAKRPDPQGELPLAKAIRAGTLDQVLFLVEKTPPSDEDFALAIRLKKKSIYTNFVCRKLPIGGEKALAAAIEHYLFGIAKVIINKNPQLDLAPPFLKTVAQELEAAKQRDSVLNNINDPSLLKMTQELEKISKTRYAFLSFLLQKNPELINTSFPAYEKQTPLHIAAFHPQGNQMVEWLLNQEGIEKNPVDTKNRTPLWLAFCELNIESVILLYPFASKQNRSSIRVYITQILETKETSDENLRKYEELTKKLQFNEG